MTKGAMTQNIQTQLKRIARPISEEKLSLMSLEITALNEAIGRIEGARGGCG